MEDVSIKDEPLEFRVLLLERLGYKLADDKTHILTKDGVVVEDQYTHQPLKVMNFIVVPGSEILLDDNIVSLSAYFDEYGDKQ
ncbi:MAG: hypothetical protein JRM77_08910 [Nitrososphaerota archaeon]|jgi:hypothetical protein|nr:hypothetical protein [Nitrososphaerota archaeon]